MGFVDEPKAGEEARGGVRTNVFLAAVLQGAGFSSPVRIRNMSEHGAQVEAPVLPSPGSEAVLVRGRLCVSCIVMWTKGNRSGLRLTSVVSVPDWLAPSDNKQQEHVDETVRLVKAGALSQAQVTVARTAEAAAGSVSAAQLVVDLRRAVLLIEKVGDELALDDAAVARHGASLQMIDVALQTISAIADTLTVQAGQISANKRT